MQSKDPKDPGDYHMGLQMAVADAETMRHIPSALPNDFSIGIDENTLYLASLDHITVWNIAEDKAEEVIDLNGISTVDERIVNMLRAGDKVFLALEKGIYVVDIATCSQVACMPFPSVRGIVETCDGNVWIASISKEDNSLTALYAYNPGTLENIRTITLPEGNRIGLSSMWWAPQTLFVSTKEPVLFWKGNSTVMRLEISENDFELRPLLETAFNPYGYPRYDGVTDKVIVPTNVPAGYSARYGYIYIVDSHNGKFDEVINLPEYYWFQEIPIFPDKYLPEILIDRIDVKTAEPLTVDLAEYVTDPDPNNMDVDIVLSVGGNIDRNIADATLASRLLTVTPVSEGSTDLVLKAMSKGRVVEKKIEVTVGGTSGIGLSPMPGLSVTGTDGAIRIIGASIGSIINIYNVSGALLKSYRTQDGDLTVRMTRGLYIVSIDGTNMTKVIVR